MAPTGDRAVRIRRRILDRYLLDDEVPIVATRRHWARLVEPVGSTFLGLFVAAWLSARLEQGLGDAVVWLLWFVLLVRAVWHLMEWRNDWFVATDRRMLMVYGLVTHKVAMMPLAKVTDMNYGRSLMGRMLGYGQFVTVALNFLIVAFVLFLVIRGMNQLVRREEVTKEDPADVKILTEIRDLLAARR